MDKYEAKKLETKTFWNGKEWRCKFCGEKHTRFYVATGHDHTDWEIDYCECRRVVQSSEVTG